jgi:hypothetical protein
MMEELKKMWMETAMDCMYGAVSMPPHRRHGNYENQS